MPKVTLVINRIETQTVGPQSLPKKGCFPAGVCKQRLEDYRSEGALERRTPCWNEKVEAGCLTEPWCVVGWKDLGHQAFLPML